MKLLYIHFPIILSKNNDSHFKVVESHFDIQKVYRVTTSHYYWLSDPYTCIYWILTENS